MNNEAVPGTPPQSSRRKRMLRGVAVSRRAWQEIGLAIRMVTPRQMMRILITLLVLVIVYWFVRTATKALIPFVIGAALAYVLMPLVDLLGRWMPRWLATLLVVIGMLAALVGLLFAVVIPLVEQLRLLFRTVTNPNLWARVYTTLEGVYASLAPDLQQMVDDGVMQGIALIRTNISDYVRALITFISTSVLSVFSLISFLIGFFVLPFWMFYTMRDRDAGVRELKQLIPPSVRADVWAVLQILDRVFSGYVRGQLLLGVIIGIASFFGLSLLELILGAPFQYKLLVSVIAGMFELLPYIGPTLSTAVAATAGLFSSIEAGIAAVVLFFIIQQVENAFLAPQVTGSSVNVHPALIMPVMIGMSSFGFLYAVLAAPLVATIRDLSRYALGRFSEPPQPAGVLPYDREEASNSPKRELRSRTTAEPEQNQH